MNVAELPQRASYRRIRCRASDMLTNIMTVNSAYVISNWNGRHTFHYSDKFQFWWCQNQHRIKKRGPVWTFNFKCEFEWGKVNWYIWEKMWLLTTLGLLSSLLRPLTGLRRPARKTGSREMLAIPIYSLLRFNTTHQNQPVLPKKL